LSSPKCGRPAESIRVRDIVEFDEEDESPFVGLVQVEAAGERWGGNRRIGLARPTPARISHGNPWSSY
jgi:hypothetical protein